MKEDKGAIFVYCSDGLSVARQSIKQERKEDKKTKKREGVESTVTSLCFVNSSMLSMLPFTPGKKYKQLTRLGRYRWFDRSMNSPIPSTEIRIGRIKKSRKQKARKEATGKEFLKGSSFLGLDWTVLSSILRAGQAYRVETLTEWQPR